MIHAIQIILLTLILSDRDVASEVGRASNGEMVTVTNAHKPFAACRILVMPSPDDPERLLPHGRLVLDRPLVHDGQDVWRLGGPIPFGVVEDAVFVANHRRDSPLVSGIGGSMLLVTTHLAASVDRLEFVRWRDQGLNAERAGIILKFAEGHTSMCTPFIEYAQQNAEDLYSTWDITFDYIYTSLDDVTVLMLRQGQMHRWTLHETGWDGELPYNPHWTTHEPFETAIEGVFRLFMAGPDLANHYIIDETGAIYTGFDREHRQIGTFQQYHSPRESTLTIIFEDQMTQKIAVVHVTEEGEVTPLPVNWRDETFAGDFLTELDDTQTAGILRLAEVIRADESEE
ncbi:MAG: hypothetical protein ACR2GY_02200 [Phycisphaerales bacterium]